MAALGGSESQQQLKKTGHRKQDLGNKKAELVLTFWNLMENRDTVDVTPPGEKESPLLVKINGKVCFKQILPGAIVNYNEEERCKTEIKYGKKAEIKITLRKAEKEFWINRWSPPLDQGDTDEATVRSLDESHSATPLSHQ